MVTPGHQHPPAHAERRGIGLVVAAATGLVSALLFLALASDPRDAVVVVHVKPESARLRLDVTGPAPKTFELSATAGVGRFDGLPRGARVRVSASAPGHKPASVDLVTAAAGGSSDATLALVAESAMLTVRTTPPGAFLFLDGRSVGRGPAAVGDVAPGAHRLEARLEGYTGAAADLTVKAGEVVPVDLVLIAKAGTPPLAVDAKPIPEGLGRVVMSANMSALFFVDEQSVGQSTRVSRDLYPGPHKGMARPSGRDQQYKRFTIVEGETVELSFTFEQDIMQRLYDANDPTKALYWITKGGSARGEGKVGDSIEMFKKALELEPTNFEAHRQLGRNYPVFKKWDEAIFHAQKYLEMNPDAPDAEFEREMIAIYEQRKAMGDTRPVMPGDPGQGEYPGSRALP